jgi:hypothetical protein
VPKGARNWLTPAAWVAAVSGVLLLVFPVGFPNYDTIYALVWGRELAHGQSPDYGAALPPTPHPLTDLLGLVSTPIGDGAITVTMIDAYLSLGLIGYLVYRLGSLWFDKWIGVVAAAIVTHDSHSPQGVTVGPPRSQLSERARIFAIEVLPVPREPTKR